MPAGSSNWCRQLAPTGTRKVVHVVVDTLKNYAAVNPSRVVKSGSGMCVEGLILYV